MMRTSPRQQPTKRFRYSPLIAALACALGTPAALAATFSVTSAADSGTGSLREAIDLVNVASNCATTGGHIIDFGPFTVASPAVIYLSSSLPSITCNNVEIKGEYKAAITPQSFLYGGICAIQGAPTAGLLKVTALQVFGFNYGGVGAGMCGKLDARDNKVHGNQRGFDLLGGSILTNNEVYLNTYGVYVTGGANLSQNTIRDNSYGGVIGGDGMVLTDNFVYGTFGPGISVGISATFTGNTVHSNSGSAGIYAEGVVSFKGNRVYNHVEGTGIEVESGTIGGPAVADRNFVYGNGTGIRITGNVTVQNNYIGTPDGITASGNYTGINIYSTGASAWSITGNVISGNNNSGINVAYASAGSITNNAIGVRADRTAALPNQIGIWVDFAYGGIAINNNTISGNSNFGIELDQSSGVSISGNKIGTNELGTAGIANGVKGIYAICSDDISIMGNTVSANGSYGLYLSGVANSQISSNMIGTTSAGTSPLANNGAGIWLESTGCFSPNGPAASDTDLSPKVAGGNLFSGNTIAHNNGDGIFVYGGTGNTITGGSIFANSGKNINLDFTPVPLANDALDPDTGPNNRQNYPVINSVAQTGGNTVVNFALNTTPATGVVIDFYANTAGGVAAGQTFLGQKLALTTDASGNVSGTHTIAGTYTNITATATGPDGTSEFSLPLAAVSPSASISATTLNFGDVIVGNTSPAQTVTIASNGSSAYQISSMVSSASPPSCPGSGVSICTSGDFSCSTNCVPFTNYVAPASCTISGTFTPNSVGAKSANLYVCDNTSPTARAISFLGNGIAPVAVSITPSSFDFGSVLVGAQSTAQRFVVANTSTFTASIGTVTAGAPFAVGATTCTTSIAPLASCTADVTFGPTALGAQSGALNVPVNNAGSSSATAPLQGTGIEESTVTLPPSVDFGSTVLGGSTLTRTVEVRNTGNGPLVISSVTATSPFQVTNGCPASVAPGATCNLTVSFPPTTFGSANGTLTFASNAAGGTRTVNLLANVNSVPYAMSPTATDFSVQRVGTESAPRALRLSNSGANSIPLGTVAVTGDYRVVSTTCGASLAAQASCDTNVAFMPTQAGSRPGTLSIPVSFPQAPVPSASLQGTGIEEAVFTLPASLDLGSTVLGGNTLSSTIEVRNTGNVPLVISSVTATAPFQVANGCPASVAPGTSCNLTVSFPPTTFGAATGTLTFASNATGGTRTITLLANVNTVPYAMSPGSTDFGALRVGSESAPRAFRLSNSGSSSIPLGTVAVTGDYRVVSTTCGASLAGQSSCDTNVAFRPTQAGSRSGTLSIPVSLAQAAAPSASLLGTGIEEVVFTLPASLDFGSTVLGGSVLTQSVEIRNTGNVALAISSIFASSPFQQTNNCPTLVAPNAPCTVNVSFPPNAFGPASGSLSVASNAPGGTRVVALSANVNSIPYSISPTSSDFGSQLVGGETGPRSYRMSNSGNSDLPLGAVALSGDFRLVSTTCTSTLRAQSSCTADVAFRPTTLGDRTGTLTIPVNLSGAPLVSVALQGLGQQALLSLPASLDLGAATLGASPLTRTIDVRNGGNFALIINSVSATAPFQVSNPCPPTLAPNGFCTLTVSLSPTAFGTFNGTLNVATNAPGSPLAVALTAAVQSLPYSLSPTAHDFGTHNIGVESPPRGFVLTNASESAIPLGSVSVTGDFRSLNTGCGASLPARSTCTTEIVFRPVQLGAVTGGLSISVLLGTGAPPAQAALQGTGAQQAVLSLPTGIDFGSAPLGSTLTQTLEVRNFGSGPLAITSIAVSGPFQMSHTCPASVTPAAACAVTMSFAGTAFGNFTGQLTIASNAAGGTRMITLLASVSGVPYTLLPGESDFGNQLLGSQSVARVFRLSNSGESSLPLGAPATTGPFRIVATSCAGSLAPRSSCTADVAFAPTVVGLASGGFSIPVLLTGATAPRVSLFGNGTQQASLTLPASLDFGAFTLNDAAGATRTIELRNTGNAVLTFTASVTGPFALSGNCGLNLSPGAACTLVITFTGTTVGEFNGALAVVSNAPGGSRSIPIIVRVQANPVAVLQIQPRTIGFGDRMLGTMSVTQRVTITNIGTVEATTGGVDEISPNFIVFSNCRPVIAPGETCTADVAFRPLLRGPQTHRLRLITNATGDPPTEFIGRGCNPPRPGRPASCTL